MASSEGGAPTSPAAAAAAAAAYVNNMLFANYLLVALASFAGAFFLYRIAVSSHRYVRTIACMDNEKQNYFKFPAHWYAFLKRHVVYAPLFHTRHHEELWLLKGWSVGVLPTRFQSIFLAAVIAMNVTFCTFDIEWSQGPSQTMLNHLRNRTGTIAVVNMIPLVFMAGRNNPLIELLGMSYDSFNMLHRWIGRIIAAEAVTHTVAFLLKEVMLSGGWAAAAKSFQEAGSVPQTGLIAVVCFVTIFLQASTLVRRAFYEFFLHFHVLLVIVAVAALWYHLDGLPQKVYIQVFIALWAAERGIRLLRLFYRNVGRTGTRAIIEALPSDAVRVTIQLSRPWTFKPGQHMFITMPSVGLWTSHPFSLAWSSEEDPFAAPTDDAEKGLAISSSENSKAPTLVSDPVLTRGRTSMSAVIRRRDGFTHRLFQKAASAAQGRLVTRAYVEGPYGGHHNFSSYGTVLLFAGGVGITHQIPYLRTLITGYASGTVAVRRLTLVWVVQNTDHLEWVRPWMTEILALERRREVLRVQLYVTKPRSTREMQSPSQTVQMVAGRPNVDVIVGAEAREQVGAMAVGVCGPGHLADEVRASVRRRQEETMVDFVEEAFSW